MPRSDIRDLGLAREGRKRVEWASLQMPVLSQIRRRFEKEKPFRKIRIGACLHVTSETANLMNTLKSGGAELALCASNPLSTQDEVAASLVHDFGISVFARRQESRSRYYAHLGAVLATRPQLTLDDGADLVTLLHRQRDRALGERMGGTEETTTGVIRLRALEREGKLLYPIVAVNDPSSKHFFDNRYGTGQSTMDGILRATNFLMAGSTVVVSGYGWCGRGVAARAQGMGARVLVTEVDPLKALEALMDGFDVVRMDEACRRGDIFITVTGNCGVIQKKHFLRMKDGAMVANAGHFDIEIDVQGLRKMAKRIRKIRPSLQEFTLKNRRRIYLLAEGRLVNLSSAEGHPATVMDMSFANQALCCEFLVKSSGTLARKVYRVPEEIDREVASLKLRAMKVAIDRLSPAQKNYLAAWSQGT